MILSPVWVCNLKNSLIKSIHLLWQENGKTGPKGIRMSKKHPFTEIIT